MLKLVDIVKKYQVGDFKQTALNGMSIEFRPNEFVAIVGPSGSGKTTTLNIIGGLDRYTSGDLIIRGKSTKQFKDADWDAYRNTSIGFVFQNYNLITHISVLDNVEMGMTLSGLGAKQRHDRAVEVLTRVGLKEHMYKRPNQLSGGQMQRVAIARALANNPEIIMADEPTGALDSKTSQQIMQLIQEIAKDKLVIMVTHNIEIANQYANRIVRMLDGKVIEDTNPYQATPINQLGYQLKRTAMSFFQAIKLSLNNLKTKLGRTLITAFAGSIGIIGVALVLALSTGLNSEIVKLQTGTLADYPITISQTVVSFQQQRPAQFDGVITEGEFPTDTTIHVAPPTGVSTKINVFSEEYLTHVKNTNPALIQDIAYTYRLTMNLLTQTGPNTASPVNLGNSEWGQLPNNDQMVYTSYDLLAGSYPETKNELLLVVNTYNELSLNLITAIGLDSTATTFDFSDFLDHTFKVVPNDDYYVFNTQTQLFETVDLWEAYQHPNSIALSISGIARIKPDANSNVLSRGLFYRPELMKQLLEDANQSDIALAQLDSPTKNVLTGTALNATTFLNIKRSLGIETLPFTISIYPKNFDAKEEIKAYLDEFNNAIDAKTELTTEEKDAQKVVYTDLAQTIFESIGSFIGAVTWVLVAFSAISLIVSSIMIGIITYVSVLERTKEIGILRSLGARKKDVARVFNAETLIIGFTAGVLGVGLAFLLTFPINFIVNKLVPDISTIAQLSVLTMILLIIVSMSLTYISGLIPARIAARKDPVEALRTE